MIVITFHDANMKYSINNNAITIILHCYYNIYFKQHNTMIGAE